MTNFVEFKRLLILLHKVVSFVIDSSCTYISTHFKITGCLLLYCDLVSNFNIQSLIIWTYYILLIFNLRFIFIILQMNFLVTLSCNKSVVV